MGLNSWQPVIVNGRQLLYRKKGKILTIKYNGREMTIVTKDNPMVAILSNLEAIEEAIRQHPGTPQEEWWEAA